MAEKTNVPEIRFAGFTDPWEQRKLGDIATRVIRKNEGESDLPLTISAQYGLVDQRTFFNNQVASKDMSGYFLLRKGEFAYNKSTSGDSPWGAVKRLVNYEKGCVSTLYICFGLDSTDPNYLVTYYETDCWHKGVQMIAAEGARNHGLLNIAPNDFFDTVLALPSSQEEQRRVGSLFARLDNLITLHQRKYDKLCAVKKSMLDKMFPKPGEVEPEIRFAGFTDPWEQRKLSELTTMHARIGWQNLRTSEFLDSGNYYLITGTDFENGYVNLSTCHYVNKDRYDQDPNIQIDNGSILITKDGTLGKVALVQGLDKPATLNAGVFNVVIRNEEIVDNGYLYQYLKAPFLLNYVAQTATGGTIKHLNQNILIDFPMSMPSKGEQELIGDAFLRLDNLITLHQRELNLLKNMKKSLLDKMFV